jgi:hypothetical protein
MPAAGISRVRARLGVTCGVVLVLGGLTHLAVNLTGAHTSRPVLLLVNAALVVSAGLLGARRAHGGKRGLQLGIAAAAVGSVLALVATPLRGALRNGLTRHSSASACSSPSS